MALIKPIHGEMSGRIGGNVYARNRGGTYVRAWANPVQPGSARQLAVRTYMSIVNVLWKSISQVARDGWSVYADNTPMTNRQGDVMHLTGFQMASRYYIPVYVGQQLGGTFGASLVAPTTYGVAGQPTELVATLSEATGLSLAYSNADEWANHDSAGIIVSLGKPRSSTRNYFKGPWRAAGYVDGDSAVPPVSPLVIAAANLPFAITEGQRVSVSVRAVMNDGRVSNTVIVDDIVGA